MDENKNFNFESDGILGKGEFMRQSALARIIRFSELSPDDRQSSIKEFVSRVNDDGSVLRTVPTREGTADYAQDIKEKALEEHDWERDKFEYNRIRNLHGLKISVQEYSAIKDVRVGDLYEDIIKRIPDLSNVPAEKINAFAQEYYTNNTFRTHLPHAGIYNLGEFQKHCRLAKMIDTSLTNGNIAPSNVLDIKIGSVLSHIDKSGICKMNIDTVGSDAIGKSGGASVEVGGEKAPVETDSEEPSSKAEKIPEKEAAPAAEEKSIETKFSKYTPEQKAELVCKHIPMTSIPNEEAARHFFESRMDYFEINTPEEKTALVEEYQERLGKSKNYYQKQNIRKFIKFLEEDTGKGKTEEVDLSGKNKQNQEEIGM